MNHSLSTSRDLLWLTLFLALLFGAFLGSRPLMTPDEGRYAEIPREMVETGDYLTPHLNYLKYFEKPPLLYWIEAAAIKTFGLNEWSLRLFIAVLSIIGCLMVYIAGLKLYDRRCGILACCLLATCTLYNSMAHFLIPDMPLTVSLSGCLLLFILGTRAPIGWQRRAYFWGMFLCAAAATLTKGLIGVALPGMIIFIWLCVVNDWRQLNTYYLPSGILLFLLVALPWHIWVQIENPEFFRFYFIDQHFLRYLTNYAGRGQAWWFFSTVTLVGFFPWICFMIAGFCHWLLSRQSEFLPRLKHAWQQRQTHKETIFLSLWALTIFVFFNLSKSQLLSYALPIMPPLAILTARYLASLWQQKSTAVTNASFIILFIICLLGSIAACVALQTVKHLGELTPGYVSAILLFLTGSISAGCYWRYGLKSGVIALMITMGACLISLHVSYATFDSRSVKSLALLIKPQLQANTEVASYHEYFQDLPVYLQRRVLVVGYTGELVFGTEHQDTRDWMLDDHTFWKRWQTEPRMFMIMKLKDYDRLKTQPSFTLYPMMQTPRNILLTNKPL